MSRILLILLLPVLATAQYSRWNYKDAQPLNAAADAALIDFYTAAMTNHAEGDLAVHVSYTYPAGTDSINGASIGARTVPDLALPATLAAKSGGVSDADYGDVTVSSDAWAVEDDSHNHTSASGKFAVAESLRVDKTAALNGMYGSTSEQSITLGSSVTTFAVTRNFVVITGDAGGNTVATITGASVVGLYTFRFLDDKVTITDTGDDSANTINLSAAFTSTDDDILTLYWNGTSWREASRSVN